MAGRLRRRIAPQLEVQLPALAWPGRVVVGRHAVHLQRADLGHLRAQQYLHIACRAALGVQHGGNRR